MIPRTLDGWLWGAAAGLGIGGLGAIAYGRIEALLAVHLAGLGMVATAIALLMWIDVRERRGA